MEHPITRASLNLTRECNLRCGFCFTYGHTKERMSKPTAFSAVDFLFSNAIKLKGKDRRVDISFWGGEPLLEWDLLRAITLYANDVSRKTAVPVHFGGTTNGTLLTSEKYDFLDEHKIHFMISFDGTSETHNRQRRTKDGIGSHAIVERNLIKVLERWPFYRVRLSPTAQRIDHFFEDMKYIFDLGVQHIMFSPVYESKFTDMHWEIFEDEGYKVVDYIVELRNRGRKADVEHFRSYMKGSTSQYPCGAGRFYVGIDVDGAIYPCHRFNKFNDNRLWPEKEVCLGHVEYGITNHEFRNKFINFTQDCRECVYRNETPCSGGCYAVNFDFTKSINTPYADLCKYVAVQKKISTYYQKKLKEVPLMDNDSCICNNLCYAQGTDNEIIGRNPDNSKECICYHANYTGPRSPDVAGPMPKIAVEAPSLEAKVNLLATLIGDIHRRLLLLEKKANGKD